MQLVYVVALHKMAIKSTGKNKNRYLGSCYTHPKVQVAEAEWWKKSESPFQLELVHTADNVGKILSGSIGLLSSPSTPHVTQALHHELIACILAKSLLVVAAGIAANETKLLSSLTQLKPFVSGSPVCTLSTDNGRSYKCVHVFVSSRQHNPLVTSFHPLLTPATLLHFSSPDCVCSEQTLTKYFTLFYKFIENKTFLKYLQAFQHGCKEAKLHFTLCKQ